VREVSEKGLPPEVLGAVQMQSALFGLTQAFKEKYGDEALKVSEAFIEKMGIRIGTQLKEKEDITGSGIEDIEKLFKVFTRPLTTDAPARSSIEGNKLTVIRESPTLCPAIHVAKQLKVPLDTVCKTVNFPTLRGLVRAINPNAKHISVELGEEKCVETFEIP
jgi:hypothetical protein